MGHFLSAVNIILRSFGSFRQNIRRRVSLSGVSAFPFAAIFRTDTHAIISVYVF